MASLVSPTICSVARIEAETPTAKTGDMWLHLHFDDLSLAVFFKDGDSASAQAYADAINAVTERLKAEQRDAA